MTAAIRIPLVSASIGMLAYVLGAEILPVLGVPPIPTIKFVCIPVILWIAGLWMDNPDASNAIDAELNAVLHDPLFQ